MRHCPACDVAHSDDPLFCLAIGVAIGTAFLDMHRATELMCAAHRTPYVMASLRAAVAVNKTDEGEGAGSMFDEAMTEAATPPLSVSEKGGETQ